MSSNLKVNNILPSTGTNIGLGTASGTLNVDGGCKVQVGTALTLGHTQGVQFHTQNLHSEGFEINQVNASGIITASSFSGSGANLTNLPDQSFNDDKIVNDISTLALKVSALENSSASNTNSTFVDTFQDSAGISTITNSSRDTTGEYITTIVDTWGSETLWGTTDLDINSFQSYATPGTSVFGGVGANMIDNVVADQQYGFYLPAPSGYTRGFGYKFGADSDFGVKTRITEIHLGNCRTNARFQDYKVQTSNDGTNWTDQEITASANASQQSSTVVRMANSDTYSNAVLNSYFQGTSTASAVRVMFSGYYNAGNTNAGISEFKMKAFKYTGNVYASGSFQSVTINAAATTSKMGVVITYTDHAGTATLNTDLKVYLSANNGTNYTQVTLVAQPNFATGVKMAKANDVTISNTGTQLKYKVEFANQSEGSKVTRVTGVSLQY